MNQWAKSIFICEFVITRKDSWESMEEEEEESSHVKRERERAVIAFGEKKGLD